MKRFNKTLTSALIVTVALFGACRRAVAFDNKRPFDISADMIDYLDANQEITAQGHVVIIQSSSSLSADFVQLNREDKRLIARGNVILREKGGILAGDLLDYDLVTEKGIIQNAKGYGSPWLVQGESWEKRKDYYVGRSASFTNCDLVDPHYHVRSTRMHFVPDQRFWAWNNVARVDDLPVFYSPFIYKDLERRRVVFQIQPGNDTVNGAFAKTATTIRFTDQIYNRFLWDHYTTAGNGVGNEFNYRDGERLKGSLFGYYIDPKGTPELVGAPKAPQWNIRSYHFQRLRSNLTLQSNVNLRKNVSFNNRFFQQDINQAVTDITSSIALTQQRSKFTHRLVFERLDEPDPADRSNLFAQTHVQSASFPRYDLTLFQTPLWSPQEPKLSTGTPVLLSTRPRWGPLLLSGALSGGQFYSRSDRRTRTRGNGSLSLSESIPLTQRISFSPSITPQLTWQDKLDTFNRSDSTVSTNTYRGFQGRWSTSNNVRFRASSALTIDQGYTLTQRFLPNSLQVDRQARDHGTEAHSLSWSTYWRPTRAVLLRSFTAYSLQTLDNEDPNDYRQRRVAPWTTELTLQPQRSSFDYFFRYQLAHYPSRVNAWEGTVRYSSEHRTVVESGLQYTSRPLRGSGSATMTLNNRLGVYLSPGWRVDTTVHAIVPRGNLSNARDAQLIDTELILVRDLHCWDAQFVYRNRPPFAREYSILFNVKFGSKETKEIADRDLESQFYPWRAGNYAR